nr:hypothetical protein [uncultured Mucilaginibacter sp.]
MIAKYLWETGSVIIALMGVAHLYGTLSSDKLAPNNPKLVADMKTASVLTEKLKLFPAWIGFNATHAVGAAFIGISNWYLAAAWFQILQTDRFLPLLTIAAMGLYVWVAKKYWITIIFVPIFIAWLCFAASFILLVATP